MFNPDPPLTKSATLDTWNSDEKYEGSVPFPLKEAVKLSHKPHRFFEVREIGVVVGSYGSMSITPGLPVGQIETLNFDQVPDWYTIAVSGETTARVFVWLGGEPSGYPIRLGPGGSITIPARGNPMITIQSRTGFATAFGTIIAHAGFDRETLMGVAPGA